MLVELAPDQAERRFRAEAYPLLLGWAAAAGWKASWCALGVRYDPSLRYELDAVGLAALCAEAARRRPTLIVLNERIPAAHLRRLSAAAGGARTVFSPPGESLPRLPAFLRSLHDGPPSMLDGARLYDGIPPTFAREVLNPDRAPWAAQPLTRICAGPRCTYRARIAPGGPFGGLELGRAMGCSFCGLAQADPEPWPMQDPVLFAVRHVEAARRAGLQRFEFVGDVLWRRIEDLLDALTARDVRGVELDFMPRIDEFLRARGILEGRLPALAETGVRLRLYGMGVENFSPAENARLNKGISAAQVHRAAGLLTDWMERFPETFRAGPLSMILFTPWTTPEDLLVNLDNLERCPLSPGALALGQRLQLFAGRPITRLAERDGLLRARSARDFYNSGCIVEFGQAEIPWAFRHPQVGALCRLGETVAAVCRNAVCADALPYVAQMREAPLAFFRRLVEAARRRPRARTPEALLGALGHQR